MPLDAVARATLFRAPWRSTLAMAALGTFSAGFVLYRLQLQEHAIRELRARVEEVAAQARAAIELLRAAAFAAEKQGGASGAAERLAPPSSLAGGLSSTSSVATLSRGDASFVDVRTAGADSSMSSLAHSDRPVASTMVALSVAEAAAPMVAPSSRPQPPPPAAKEPRWDLPAADALFDESRHSETIALLGGATPLPAGTEEGERLWRLARALHGEACEAGARGAKEAQRAAMAGALELAQQAVALEPGSFAAHKWLGIVISEASALDGTKAAIERSVDVRLEFERAVALNPHDATSRHLLGLWHYEIASIGWWQAKAAAALFAEPPSSTHEVALELLLAAENLSPGWYKKNRLVLAKTHLKLGDKGEARNWLAAALELPSNNADDKAAHAEALALWRTLS